RRPHLTRRLFLVDKGTGHLNASHGENVRREDIAGAAARLQSVFAGSDDRGPNSFGRLDDRASLPGLVTALADLPAELRTEVTIGFGGVLVNVLGDAPREYDVVNGAHLVTVEPIREHERLGQRIQVDAGEDVEENVSHLCGKLAAELGGELGPEFHPL